MHSIISNAASRSPWNKGKLVGQKRPLKLKEVWEVHFRLESAGRCRDLAMFNLAIDSKLRACDLLRLRVSDVSNGGRVGSRAMILQKKTARPVQFEITYRTREAISAWIQHAGLGSNAYLFPSRNSRMFHLSTRQYARIVE